MHRPNSDASPGAPQRLKRVWDVPVRIMHASFIGGVAGAWLTRSGELVDWHAVFGYTALAAFALRIAWGFAGPTHARFASFAYSPLEALRYFRAALRGSVRHYTGHNPAGSWSVYLLLGLIAATCASGVIASAGLHDMGPVAGVMSFNTGDVSFSLHEALAWLVLATALLHLLGVAWGSRVHRENLAFAMVTGKKIDHEDDAPQAPARASIGMAMLILILAGATAYLAWHAPREVELRRALEQRSKEVLASQPWSRECSGCHLAYSPALLPLRSWERMLREQDRHFGEDLSLSSATSARLLEAARVPAPSWGAWKLAASAGASAAPQRITELPSWREMHRRVAEHSFSPPIAAGRHDCEACHRDAASGIFHPRMIQSTKPGNDS